MPKYSNQFNRDYDFYHSVKDVFTFSGRAIVVPNDPEGVDGKECFYIKETTGKIVPSCEPILAQAVLQCKGSINLHIAMYAKSLTLGLTTLYELRQDVLNKYNCPEWVETAIQKQAYKDGWLSDWYGRQQIKFYKEFKYESWNL